MEARGINDLRNIYVNESTSPISTVQLSANSGTTLIGTWKKRKNMWYIFEPGSENNVMDVLTPRPNLMKQLKIKNTS